MDAVQDNVRTGRTSRGEQHSSTPCFPVGCWSLMDCASVSSGSWSMLENCTKLWVYENLQRFGYPMKSPRCNNGTAMQSHKPYWTGTKRKVKTLLDESPLWMKPGLVYTNQTWNAHKTKGSIPVLLVQRKWAIYIVLWRWCSLWCMTLMSWYCTTLYLQGRW